MSPKISCPFHRGEREVQARLGVREQVESWAHRVIRPVLAPAHRTFYASLPYLVIAARDRGGRVWASVLAGGPGFASAPDPGTLELREAALGPDDALVDALVPGADLGVLGIELATRRRNRVNGRLVPAAPGCLRLAVGQSFGNCPQHIRPRGWVPAPLAEPDQRPAAVRRASLSPAQQAKLRAADTLFIASGHRGVGDDPAFGMDASHRGGPPGFVTVEDPQTVVIPDYSGNKHFNTIGNLVVDPRAGLLFVDFETGGLIQLSGRATIDWQPSRAAALAGARRLIRVRVEAVVEQPAALPLRWRDAGDSLTLGVVGKARVSDEVCALTLITPDGAPLPRFAAGQHLPIEVDIPGHGRVARSYSLSRAPPPAGAPTSYRISVKREAHGLVSSYLHDVAEPGTLVHARAPAGEFVLPGRDSPEAATPIVLVSAGVGITPMLSMAEARVRDADAGETVFVHQARSVRQRAHADELAELAATAARLRVLVAHSQPGADELAGRDYDLRGRIDAATLVAFVARERALYYLCGPIGFMAAISHGLAAHGVTRPRIRTESFAS